MGLSLARQAQAKPNSQSKPNIVYINIDDMGWSDPSFMGSRYYETPHIDRLAKQGVVFTNAYAPAANCAPSRACCMSGQYSPRHGIYTVGNADRGKAIHRQLIPTENRTILPDDILTIPEALQSAGYATCHVGKWHLGEDPTTQGIDVNIGGTTYGHPRSYFSPYKNKVLKDGPKGEYLTDRLTNDAIAFVNNHKNQPFFLYLSYYAVHTPLQAKQEIIEKYKNKPGTRTHNNPVYAAMIETLDRNIGKVMQTLDDLGLTDNTFVVFTSDNGGVYRITRQWPLRAGKGSYYEGGIREPMIVRWPGKVKPGAKCHVPVSGIDFFPTFLDIAGIQKPQNKILDGQSLKPLLTGEGDLPQRPLFWHFPIYLQRGNGETADPLFRTRPGTAMRLGEWKLIEYFEDNRLELYNLKHDLAEKNNLANTLPGKTQELHARMKAWRKRLNAPVPNQPNPQYDAEKEHKAIVNWYQN
ncbi:sulfatase-like hydrolase/transferase [bacterium]|nr:sulfatase-like hydrolase/transferase [bacterium]